MKKTYISIIVLFSIFFSFVPNVNATALQVNLAPDNCSSSADITISANADIVVFVCNLNELYLNNSHGTNLRKLYEAPLGVGIFDPSISADGLRIVFSATLNNNFAIYSINPDGSNLKKISPYNSLKPAISGNGQKVVFTGHSSPFIMNYDGSSLLQLATTSMSGTPSISYDGSVVVFRGQPPLPSFIVNGDGNDLRQIPHSNELTFSPLINADGSKILFADDTTPRKVYITDIDGSNYREISNNLLNTFVLSADESKVVYSAPNRLIELLDLQTNITTSIGVGGNPKINADGSVVVFWSGYDSNEAYKSILLNVVTPSVFWAQIKDSPQGWLNLRATPGTISKPSDDIIKTLPNEWIVKVTSTTDTNNAAVDLDGYRWYQVTDITDNSSGWIAGKSLATSVEYLEYDPSIQVSLEQKATSTPYLTEGARIPAILQAVDAYYIQSTSTSLYGSGGGLDGLNNFNKFIQGSIFPKELMLAIAGHESAGTLDNEICAGARDGGIGIMQITTEGYKGLGSALKNYPKLNDCRGNISTSQYYSNSVQGIHASMKDGFRVFQDKYRKKCPNAQITIGELVYSCQDIEKILMTWGYNGKVLTGNYLKQISNSLNNLSSYFPGINYANTDKLIEKLSVANSHRIEFKKFSPVEVLAIDSQGRKTGLDYSQNEYEEIPFSNYDINADGGVIFFPEDMYTYRVVGTGSGIYDFKIDSYENETPETVFSDNISIVPSEVHEYAVDWNALSRGEPGVTVTVDKQGDGVIDYTITTGSNIQESDLKYMIEGFLPPIKEDGSGVYNKGKTLPVKFKLRDANGNPYSGASARLYIAKISNNATGGDEIPLSSGGADTGNEFRYDRGAGNYVYNLSTGSMSTGLWQIKAVLGNGQVITTVVSIR